MYTRRDWCEDTSSFRFFSQAFPKWSPSRRVSVFTTATAICAINVFFIMFLHLTVGGAEYILFTRQGPLIDGGGAGDPVLCHLPWIQFVSLTNLASGVVYFLGVCFFLLCASACCVQCDLALASQFMWAMWFVSILVGFLLKIVSAVMFFVAFLHRCPGYSMLWTPQMTVNLQDDELLMFQLIHVECIMLVYFVAAVVTFFTGWSFMTHRASVFHKKHC